MIKEMLTWCHNLIHTSSEERNEIVDMAMNPIRYSKTGEKLARDLMNKKEYELVGIVPNISYISTNKNYSKSKLESLWIHPFSRPTLLFYNKRYHYYMLINANLRKDKSILENIKANKLIKSLKNDLETMGITG